MSNTYSIRTSVGAILRELNELQKWTVSENVTIHGRGYENYAYDRNQNLVYMLENFAGSPAPTTPLDGQLWWDVNTTALRVWNDVGSPQSKWDPVVPGGAGVGFRIKNDWGLKNVGSPVVTLDDIDHGILPTGSPLTIEFEIGTNQTTLQNIVVVDQYTAGGATDRIFTSSDGFNWTRRVHATADNIGHYKVAFSPTIGRFIITHRNRDISYSDDGGVTWALSTNAFPVSGASPLSYWSRVDWIPALGMFLAANFTGDIDEDKIAYSSDGLSWTLAVTTGWDQPGAEINSRFQWIDSLGIVVNMTTGPSNNYPNATSIVWSYDGITWTYAGDIHNLAPWSSYADQDTNLIYSDVAEKLVYYNSNGSNATLGRIWTYDTAAVGSPLFGFGQWTNEATQPPVANNQRMFGQGVWAGGTINRFLAVGDGGNNGSSGGSPDPDLMNLVISDGLGTWQGIKINDTGGGGSSSSQFLYAAEYIPSLDRAIIIAETIGSPQYGMWISDVGDVDRQGSWTSVSFPWTSGAHILKGISYGEVTLTGVSVAANSISIDESTLNHDALSGYVSTEHTDHSNVTLSGNGMSNLGDLTANQTFTVIGGDGITANANDVEVNSTVVRTTGTQGISGIKTFDDGGSIRVGDGTASQPGFAFYTDTDNGIYRSAPNELSFSTAGQPRFSIISTGVLRALDTTYEILVTEDDDIPNKKYVDDAAAGATGVVTENTFTSRGFGGILSIGGLNPGSKYLVGIFGVIRNNGTGSGTHGGIRVTDQHNNPPTAGVLYQGPLHGGINWPDGHAPQSQWCVITAPAGGQIYGYTDYRDNTPPAIEWRYAMHMTAVQLD